MEAALAVALLAAVPDSAAVRQASTLCRRGEAAAVQGDAAKAEKLFQRALEVFPDFPDARLGLGHLAMAERRYADALVSYRGAREGFASLGEALAELRATRYRDAQQELQDVQAQIADLARSTAWDLSGTTGFEHMDESAKLQDRLRMLQAIPVPTEFPAEPPADVHFHEGVALFRLERYQDAETAWRTCARLNPQFGAVHQNLAVLAWKAGRLEEAEAELDRAEALGFAVDPKMRADLARVTGSAPK